MQEEMRPLALLTDVEHTSYSGIPSSPNSEAETDSQGRSKIVKKKALDFFWLVSERDRWICLVKAVFYRYYFIHERKVECFLYVYMHLNKHKSGPDQLPEKSVEDCHLDVG